MYSLVLMMVLNTQAAGAPAFGFGHGCCGGCYGCSGCCGGCDGCCGGCCGGCFGCCGGCGGCDGCCGGCCGGGHILGFLSGLFHHGCCGGCWGCDGCCGGCCGGEVMMYGAPGAPVAPVAPAAPDGKMPAGEKPAATGMMSVPQAPATIVVNLPAQAQLLVDGVPTKSLSGVRSFITPALSTSENAMYTLTAEMVVNGQKVTRSANVMVRGGKESHVTIDLPIPASLPNVTMTSQVGH